MQELTRRNEIANLYAAIRMVRWPLIGWIVLDTTGTLILQSIYSLELERGLFFGGLILLHISLLWHFETLTGRWSWLYFVIQALIIHGSAFLVPQGSPVLLIGLNPILFGLTIARSSTKKGVIAAGAIYYALYGITISWVYGPAHLGLVFPLFILMTVVVGAVSELALRQVHSQLRTQTFLAELEIAHKRVEELTIANERQRMARDLHDTLAQGLAGIIMQLEAVDAHLTVKHYGRAQEIVGMSMERARRTLAEARQVIDDLRLISFENYDFVQMVQEEIERYEPITGIKVHVDLNEKVRLNQLLTEHCFQIVKECMANAAKHAEADHVWIWMDQLDSLIRIEVFDDGIGFNTDEIGKRTGHYGLIGIQERVRIIGGAFEVSSGSDGTVVRIDVPLEGGATNEI